MEKGLLAAAAVLFSLAACKDSAEPATQPGEGSANEVFTSAEWYPGGLLGTTSNEVGCYSNPAPAVEEQGFSKLFADGELFFERDYTLATRPFTGLGPAWVRPGCTYCHPNYGHGSRQGNYKANTMGNGYLLVVYHPESGVTSQGVKYAKDSYVSEVTGMPQTAAQHPFKAPVDESQIKISWLQATDEHGNRFPDGETYGLIYPDVEIPATAFNTDPVPENYEVRLESTIGIYGTGLLDAISQDSMKAQYALSAKHLALNPAMWDSQAGDWAGSAWYTLADGQKRIKKFTYAMTRASLQDGAGSNAIWNITNVTRSDRRYLYTTDAWARKMANDGDVVKTIMDEGASAGSLLHPYYGDGTEEGVREMVEKLLGLNQPSDAEEYARHFVNAVGADGKDEMFDEDYYAFAVWHRGLGVPMARDLDKAEVQRGKQVFMSIGCANCHRPSWQIVKDDYWTDPITKAVGKGLPDYSGSTIWPYTDLVQHRLFMENDIRTGWCRTTPLWGRGLSVQETGYSDRLHDCRARNVIEAIMWHGYDKRSDAYSSTQRFYNLPKEDRDAVVAFIEAI